MKTKIVFLIVIVTAVIVISACQSVATPIVAPTDTCVVGKHISEIVKLDAKPGERGYLEWSRDGLRIDGVTEFHKRDDGLWYANEPPCDFNPPRPIEQPIELPSLDLAPQHQACDGTEMTCPEGQYCFITDTIGLPEGVCIQPGESVP